MAFYSFWTEINQGLKQSLFDRCLPFCPLFQSKRIKFVIRMWTNTSIIHWFYTALESYTTAESMEIHWSTSANKYLINSIKTSKIFYTELVLFFFSYYEFNCEQEKITDEKRQSMSNPSLCAQNVLLRRAVSPQVWRSVQLTVFV